MEQPTAAQRIRTQTKEATRRALLESGLAETIDRGGEVPSIEAICSRAGYTRGAFYVYFRDREHFIAEMLDWVLNDIIRTLFVDPTEAAEDLAEVVMRFNKTMTSEDWPDVQSNIRAGYLAVLRELRPGSKVHEQHAELMLGIVRRLEHLLREGQRAGTVRDGVNPHNTALFLLHIAVGSILWDRVGIPVDGRDIANTLISLLHPPE